MRYTGIDLQDHLNSDMNKSLVLVIKEMYAFLEIKNRRKKGYHNDINSFGDA